MWNKRKLQLPILLILLLSLTFISGMQFASGTPNWLTSWLYRKNHLILGSAGAGVGYTISLTVHYGSGTSTGSNVYLDSHSKTDFGDVRFTSSDGDTLLDYWMETSISGISAIFWVEVADTLESNATIYVYYGKSDATTTSSLANTFIRDIDSGTPNVLALPIDEGTGTITYDKSGQNNNGTITGAGWTDGKYEKALSFDGINDDVIVSSMTFDLITLGFTMSAWVNLTYDASITNYWLIGRSANLGVLLQNIDGTHYSVFPWVGVTGGPIGSVHYGEWHFITVVFVGVNTDTQIVYVDGVYINTQNSGGVPNIWTGTVMIGRNTDYGWILKGIIDEVRIYNRALTQNEITDMYNNRPYDTLNLAGRTQIRKYVSPEPVNGVWFGEEREHRPLSGDGLVAYYPFDEGSGSVTYDQVGNNHGVLYGGVSWASGKYGFGLDFDGGSGYVDCGNDTAFEPSNLTLSVWVYPEVLPGENGTMVVVGKTNYTGSDYRGYNIYEEFDGVNCCWKAQVHSLFLESSAAVLLNAWQHLVLAVENNGDVYLYMNGKLSAYDTTTLSGFEHAASDFMIGVESWQLDKYFDGVIDEVALFNRTLSGDEVAELYSATTASAFVNFQAVEAQNPRAYMLAAGILVVFILIPGVLIVLVRRKR